jgi:hypothetical protein
MDRKELIIESLRDSYLISVVYNSDYMELGFSCEQEVHAVTIYGHLIWPEKFARVEDCPDQDALLYNIREVSPAFLRKLKSVRFQECIIFEFENGHVFRISEEVVEQGYEVQFFLHDSNSSIPMIYAGHEQGVIGP